MYLSWLKYLERSSSCFQRRLPNLGLETFPAGAETLGTKRSAWMNKSRKEERGYTNDMDLRLDDLIAMNPWPLLREMEILSHSNLLNNSEFTQERSHIR